MCMCVCGEGGHRNFERFVCWMPYVYNVQCVAQDAACHLNISALMQPPFKFWLSSGHYGHLISSPKAYSQSVWFVRLL